jgi:hypothetical protein
VVENGQSARWGQIIELSENKNRVGLVFHLAQHKDI